jgi:peptide/nickel transport system ATP-binding protein
MATDAETTSCHPTLRVLHLNHRYSKGPFAGRRQAALNVSDVSFDVACGQTLSIIGESGSGKSTIVKCVLGIEKPESGEILIDGINRFRSPNSERNVCSRKVQAVFQDSASSLNPRLRVDEVIVEPLLIHGVGDSRSRTIRMKELLDAVGLPRKILDRRPPELSGGQRQRVAIARALSIQPMLLVLDEPLTALDLSVKAQLSNLLLQLQDELKLAYLLISHDLFGVANLSDFVAVLREGQIVEYADAKELFANPRHVETRALLAASFQ